MAGARAFPPLMVVLFHFSEGHHYSGVPWIDLVATRGYLWVEFFFVLSGFILTHVYAARLADLFTRRGYGGFLKARLIRLYPLHLAVLLILVAELWLVRGAAQLGGYVSIYDVRYHPDMSLKGFALSLLLVHAWNTMDRLTWNGVSWFVSVEFALCLIFPLLLRMAGTGKSKFDLGRGLALLAAGLAGVILLNANSQHGLDITFHNGVLRGLAEFSVGMGLAVLFRHADALARLPSGAHSLFQAALLVWLGWATYRTGWSHTHKDILTVLPIMAMVFVLAFDKGFLADALKTSPAQVLGRWSYAVYLGQTVWLQAMRVFEQRLYPPADTIVLGTHFSTLMWWLEPTLLILVCVLWGGLLASYIEHPLTRWLKRRLESKSEARLDRPGAVTPS